MWQGLARLQPFAQAMRQLVARPAIKRTIRLGFGLVSILAVGYVLVAGVGRVDWAALNIDWRYIVLAWLATAATVGVGALGWTLLARALLPAIPAKTLTHIHLRSLLAKYLPGGVWNSASKLVLLHQLGAPAKHASLAVLLEPALLLLTGLEALLIMVSVFPSAAPWAGLSPPLLLLLLALTTLACLSLPLLVMKIVRRNQNPELITASSELIPRSFITKLWMAEAVYGFSWLCLCLCFNLIVAAILPIDIKAASVTSVATILSFIICLVVIVIPNGIGLRELSYSVLMSKIMDSVVAVSLGFMFRLIIALAEVCVVMVALGAVYLHKTRIRRKKQALTPMEY